LPEAAPGRGLAAVPAALPRAAAPAAGRRAAVLLRLPADPLLGTASRLSPAGKRSGCPEAPARTGVADVGRAAPAAGRDAGSDGRAVRRKSLSIVIRASPLPQAGHPRARLVERPVDLLERAAGLQRLVRLRAGRR